MAKAIGLDLHQRIPNIAHYDFLVIKLPAKECIHNRFLYPEIFSTLLIRFVSPLLVTEITIKSVATHKPKSIATHDLWTL